MARDWSVYDYKEAWQVVVPDRVNKVNITIRDVPVGYLKHMQNEVRLGGMTEEEAIDAIIVKVEGDDGVVDLDEMPLSQYQSIIETAMQGFNRKNSSRR